MYKLIRLCKRAPGMSREQFHIHWRDAHAPVVATLPGIKRYVLSLGLLQGYVRGELIFDGISELWFDSADSYLDAQASQQWSECLALERDMLDHARTVVMPVDVHVIKATPFGPNAVKNIEFVKRRGGMDLEHFRRYWREVHGPLAAGIELLRRYEQNHLCMGEYGTDRAPAYDGLAITWFDSTADMKAGTTTPVYHQTREDERNFLPDGHLPIIITREQRVL